MPDPPEGFTEAKWHVAASNDAEVDHALHPRQYVVTCEWCSKVFFGPHKADALRQLDWHRKEIDEQYRREWEFGRKRCDPAPIDADSYAQLVAEFVDAEDAHDKYRLRWLVRWHVPTPWRSWFAFASGSAQLKGAA